MLVALAASTPTAPRAQTAPPTGGDLTLPPAWRGHADEPLAAKIGLPKPKAHHAAEKTQTVGSAKPQLSPKHSVDLGVVMRGGSGTSRVYGAAGTSEAIQESGSTFGAGMRFGF